MWNNRAPYLEIDWTRSDVPKLCTDASVTLSYGAYFSGAWFNGRWPDSLLRLNPSIECFEMLPFISPCAFGKRSFSKEIDSTLR